MSNLFNSTIHTKQRKNAFSLSHDIKTSLKFGALYPILCEETLPGDIFQGNTQILMRMAPMLAPVMHKINAYVHFFYVPNRILWDNWEDFITGEDESIVPPYISPKDIMVENGSLLDHLGFPSASIPGIEYSDIDSLNNPSRRFNALPIAAYQRIWFEYYRDQNIDPNTSTPQSLKLTNGLNAFTITDASTSLGRIRFRSWLHDYFTSALPWAQKGAAAMIPMELDNPSQSTKWYFQSTGLPSSDGDLQVKGGAGETSVGVSTTYVYQSGEEYENQTTIEDLRRAFRLQEWLERNARGGTRYIESILSHFGERVRDYRLERPEYIGGRSQRIQISEVLQTSETSDTGTALATMAGHGISAANAGGYNYKCPEHGWIIGILSVMPNTAYYQGVPRKFGARGDRLDYYWPSFAHLGEQSIQTKELYLNNHDNPTEMEETFGYTPRYSEYRWGKSTVSGDFNTTLDFWHLARKFPVYPTLSEDFIRVAYNENEDWDRIFAVQDGTDYLWAHINHDIKAIRPMPRFATPSK